MHFKPVMEENVIVLVLVGLASQLHCLQMANFETKSNLT